MNTQSLVQSEGSTIVKSLKVLLSLELLLFCLSQRLFYVSLLLLEPSIQQVLKTVLKECMGM